MSDARTCPQLPDELWLAIAEFHFGPCALRRHVVAHLQQMAIMNINHADIGTNTTYRSHARDHQIRRQAGMTPQKSQYYNNRRRQLALIERPFELCRLVAEKEWLQHPPMDYSTFQHFCNNPTLNRYENTEDLVIELFPQAEFFRPPEALSDAATVTEEQFWKDAERQVSAQRGDPNVGYSHLLNVLDAKLYESLCSLWTRALPNLPPHVRRVTALCKCPDAPYMLQGLPNGDPLSAVRVAGEGNFNEPHRFNMLYDRDTMS